MKKDNKAFWLWLFNVSKPFLTVVLGSAFLIIGGVNDIPSYSLIQAIGYTLNNVWGWVGTPIFIIGVVWTIYIIIMGFVNSFKR